MTNPLNTLAVPVSATEAIKAFVAEPIFANAPAAEPVPYNPCP